MSKQQPPQFPHSIGLAPTGVQGVRVIPVTVSFPGAVNTIQVYNDDFFIEEQDGTINGIQSVYFDNSRNFAPMYLVINETQQALTLPAQMQGYLPVFALNGMSYTVSFMGSEAGEQGNAVLKLMFYNTPCQPFMWNAYANEPSYVQYAANVSGAALTATTNGASQVYPNRRIFVDGVDASVTGTISSTGMGLALSNILFTSQGQGGQNGWTMPLSANGGFWRQSFSPPLMAAFGTAIPGGGYNSTNPVFSSAAITGSPVTVQLNLYWHLN